MRLLYILLLTRLVFLSGYIQLSSLKTKMFHRILINNKIKSDFKKITSNDAYQIVCFWHDELIRSSLEENNKIQNDCILYNPTSKHIFDNSVNLTDFKYNIISDIHHKNEYYIWRPKIQICLPLSDSTPLDENEINKTQLYPSFRETMHLLSLEKTNRYDNAIVINLVQSPYWNEPENDTYKIMQYSVKTFFVNYLKYSGVKYK